MSKSLVQRLIAFCYARLNSQSRSFVADLAMRNFEQTTYQRLANIGFSPDSYIDVGAFHGDWSCLANTLLGPRPTLMIEGQQALLPRLEALAASRPGFFVAGCVLSATAGIIIQLYEMGTGSSLFAEASNAPRTIKTLKTRTLDEVAGSFIGPASAPFLKVDVQGAELKVLAGGEAVLSKASLVQLEVAMLPYNRGAPLMPDVIAWMAERGWLPTDISGFSRPSGPLVQIDVLFPDAKTHHFDPTSSASEQLKLATGSNGAARTSSGRAQ